MAPQGPPDLDSCFPADPNHWKLASYAYVSLNSASLLTSSAYDSYTLPVSLSSLGPLGPIPREGIQMQYQ